jgi:hypothetical protein
MLLQIMKTISSFIIVFLTTVAISSADAVRVVCPENATPRERLAAAEIVRYVYLRTGRLPVIGGAKGDGHVIVLNRDTARLGPQQFELKSDGKRISISGGDDVGVLYGAYRFAEKLGVRFYLHGDVVPDEPLAALPELNETGKPLFPLRGVNPWGAHPFGIDAWTADDYKAIFAQLAKMRMNFLGFHCYPESVGHWGPEPPIWHGLAGDFDAAGQVTSSYPSRYFNILGRKNWTPKLTSQFSFGGSLLFERDDWAPPVMQGHCPAPTAPADCNEVFNRMGAQLRDAFTFARTLDVKTCIGTETPLYIPKAVRERLKAQGKNPDDPACVREVYEGTFRRIMAAHPLDYYWIWTPEEWTWSGNKPKQYSNTVADVRLAIEALKASGAPFKLATCGWVLGPQHDRAAFDHDLPKNVPMSAISRVVGWTEVDPAFGRIQGREKWAIPWFESDEKHGLAALQLFVGRMRRDAADALAYGCTGLMGLHWRTDILAPNAAALAQAAWDQTGWNPLPGGKLPVEATPTVEGPVGGNVANYHDRKIADTNDAPLYQTCRYGLDGYNLKLPNGRYRVTLKFCEPHFDAAGQRVGDFKLQGKTVIQNLDIFARVGKFAALDFSFDNIEVTDGWLRLGVEARTSLPLISAILVEGATATRKINCGGPAYKDFEGDVQAVATAKKRDLPCDDFYTDWARANFGLAEAGKVFAAVDGRLPMSVAGGCPSGSLKADPTPWEKVATNYVCVAELEALRPRVKGPGNLDRFDWWLNTFRYHRSLHRVRCVLGEFDALLNEKKPEAALTKYRELLSLYGETYRLLLATVNTPGGLAMVVNLENRVQFWPIVVEEPAKKLGIPAAQPPREFQGAPRIIVPTVRSIVSKGEKLAINFIVLDNHPPKSVMLAWRPLGKGVFRNVKVRHVARGVYRAELPPASEHFEYRLEAETAAGKQLVWPPTAPALNQTVVLW